MASDANNIDSSFIQEEPSHNISLKIISAENYDPTIHKLQLIVSNSEQSVSLDFPEEQAFLLSTQKR